MKYILYEYRLNFREGIKCDSCGRKFWRGVRVINQEDEEEMKMCPRCDGKDTREKVGKFFRDDKVWIFDSRFYKCKS